MPDQQSPHDASAASPDARVATVLIAEDNETNRNVLELYLSKYHCRFLVAKNGRDAVALFRDHDVDLILMDIMMPVMDGFEATKRMRRMEKEKGAAPTPIIAVTAHVDPADQHLCINAGMNDYLSKPLGRSDLRRAIAIWAPRLREGMSGAPGQARASA